MAKIIMESLQSYTIRWNHLSAALNFDGLRSLLGIDCHNLRNVHDIELFRSEGGIFCRWKQYMSDDVWSRPRLLVRPDHIHVVAKAVPEPIRHSFSDAQKSKFEDFLNKVEMFMASSNLLGEKEQEGMKWLKKNTSTDMDFEFPVKQMIADFERANGGCGSRSMVGTLHEVPDDILYGVAPGADLPPMPLESLMAVTSAQSEENVRPALDLCVVAMDYVVVKHKQGKLKFVLGQVMDIDYEDQSAIVEWYHPQMSKEANMRQGRKKQILDVFGPWVPCEQVEVSSLEPLPPSVIKADQVCWWGFELEDGDKIPFDVLDGIMDDGMDITGLNMSSTPRGNLYRAHRLMKR